MEGSEMKRDKSKAFKVTADTLERVNKMIKKTGKGDTEFFEDLVSELEVEMLTSDDNPDIPLDLRKSFQVDAQKLKTATNSILSLFTSQMENISVEKNNWAFATEQQLKIRDLKISEHIQQHEELKRINDLLVKQSNETGEANTSLSKERDALLKQSESQAKLVFSLEEKIQDLSSRINELNQLIVEKDEALKKMDPLQEENRSLQMNLAELDRIIKTLEKNQPAELQKQADSLRFEFEKEKLNLSKESSMEQEKVRTETREKTERATQEFYLSEIERLQASWDKKEKDYTYEIEKLRESKQKS